jgi:hypothetical protein
MSTPVNLCRDVCSNIDTHHWPAGSETTNRRESFEHREALLLLISAA